MNHFERKAKDSSVFMRAHWTKCCSLLFSSKWRRSFAVVFEKCQHQDSFLGIYTSKGSNYIRLRETEKHSIYTVMGMTKGRRHATCPTKDLRSM